LQSNDNNETAKVYCHADDEGKALSLGVQCFIHGATGGVEAEMEVDG